MNGNGNKEEELENTFDIYMFNCQKTPSEKFLQILVKRLDTTAVNTMEVDYGGGEKKITVALADKGELVYNKTKRYDEISLDSEKKDLHDLYFYIMHNFYPKHGTAYYYGNSKEHIDLPKHFVGNPDDAPIYVREILRDYPNSRPTMLEDMAKLRFVLRLDWVPEQKTNGNSANNGKNSSLEQKVEEKSESK